MFSKMEDKESRGKRTNGDALTVDDAIQASSQAGAALHVSSFVESSSPDRPRAQYAPVWFLMRRYCKRSDSFIFYITGCCVR